MSSHGSNVRPAPDPVLTDIADYVIDFEIAGPETWRAARYFVMDARARYKLDENWNVSVGIDNLNNDRYFLFHPFPGRTFIASLKIKL